MVISRSCRNWLDRGVCRGAAHECGEKGALARPLKLRIGCAWPREGHGGLVEQRLVRASLVLTSLQFRFQVLRDERGDCMRHSLSRDE